MQTTTTNPTCWPENPAWPDPSGNDPYDIAA